MDITCDKCQSKFKIANDKIPSGRKVSIPCPKCKKKITLHQDQEPVNATNDVMAFDEDDDVSDESDSSLDSAVGSAFDFTEEEGKTVLICEEDAAVKKKITTVLNFMEYHITEAKDTRDALKKFRFHVYDLVVLNENFNTRTPDSNGILIYISRMEMAIRRRIFVVLLSNRFRTMNNMATLQKSVNLIVNLKDIKEIEKIVTRGISEHEYTYRILQESLKNTGRV